MATYHSADGEAVRQNSQSSESTSSGSQTPTHEPINVSEEGQRDKYYSSSAHDPEKDTGGLENSPDLERATTASTTGRSLGRRISRVETMTQRRQMKDSAFTHPLAHSKTGPDVVVDFDGPDDPYRAVNWPFRKKCITTALYGLTTMGATLSSSIYSPTVEPIAEEFGVGSEVSLLGISFVLLGFGLGPLVWAPVSEYYGRKAAVLTPYFIGAMFNFGAGSAKDIQTILICRFFAGFFSSAPVTNTGGVLGDIWHPTARGTAIVFYAFAVVGGPVFGPIIGGAMIVRGVSWRWTDFLCGIFMTVIWFIDLVVLDETYSPVLLVHKATRLRISTGNWALHAKHEEWDPSLKEMLLKFGIRPFQMLMTPICFCVAIYASFVYGLLYGNFAGFPVEFEQLRGWNPLVGSLPFLALLVGIVIGGLLNMVNQKFYIAKWKAAGEVAVPEARLPPMMGGSIIFTAGLFLFAWTSSPHVQWIGPVIGTALIGLGFILIFQSALNYLIDTFQRYAASAVAVNTFLRSVFGLAFPLFVQPMYHAIGVDWGTSIFGFFSILLIPIPFIFYIYGPKIRKSGKFSANMG